MPAGRSSKMLLRIFGDTNAGHAAVAMDRLAGLRYRHRRGAVRVTHSAVDHSRARANTDAHPMTRLALAPSGRLRLVGTASEQELAVAAGRRISEAFARGEGAGLLHLGLR